MSKAAVAYSMTGLVSVLALVWVLALRHADFDVPLQYWAGGETMVEYAWVKSLGEFGWYLRNPRLGAPGVQDLHDFPLVDSLHFALMRVLYLFTSSWGAVANAYYLIGFLLAAWAALAVFSRLGFGYLPAACGALLFAFAPYHFWRAQGHMQLSSYYLVPFAVLLALWVWQQESFWRRKAGRRLPRLTRKGIAAVSLGLLIGCAGVYYAFFAVFFLLVAGCRSILSRRSAAGLLGAALPAAAICLAVGANVTPTVVYMARHGVNKEVAKRYPHESELYGMKVIQLLLPVQNHRIPRLARARTAYDRTSPLVNENSASSLGVATGIGFLILLCIPVAGVPRGLPRSTLRGVATFNLSAVLLGTIGGFGTVFAWFVSPKVRAYNRISIYIAFLSLIALVAVLDALWKRASQSRRWRTAAASGVLLFLAAGLLDQTVPFNPALYGQGKRDFLADAGFYRSVESVFPPGAWMLQLPHMSYPESPPIHHLRDYEHLRAFLHTHSLRFSYGAIRGRHTDAWLRILLERHSLEQAMEAASVAGFDGVLLDRLGFSDGGAEMERALTAVLGPPVRTSTRWLCFDLRQIRKRTLDSFDPTVRPQLREAVLYPPILRWEGFYGREQNAQGQWRWAPDRAALHLENPGSETLTLELETQVLAGCPGGCSVRLEAAGLHEELQLEPGVFVPLRRRFDLPPGRLTIRFSSDGRPLEAAGDPRTLVFRLVNPQIRVLRAEAVPTHANPLFRPRVLEAN